VLLVGPPTVLTGVVRVLFVWGIGSCWRSLEIIIWRGVRRHRAESSVRSLPRLAQEVCLSIHALYSSDFFKWLIHGWFDEEKEKVLTSAAFWMLTLCSCA
jgi:hypothetical protein